MKLRLLLITVLILLFAGFNAFAKKVSTDDASKVARNFMFERINQYGNGISYPDILVREMWEVSESYYVFNLNQGWVIVASRDERHPVIGYNLEGSFPRPEELNYNTNSWLTTFIDEKDYILSHGIVADEEVQSAWNRLLTEDISTLNTEELRDAATPLLTSLWNQDSPYNLMCPEDEAGPGGRVYVGCVATAMSMIMHYWRYPLQGIGSYSYYQNPYGIITADFGNTYYNWDGMQDQIETEHPWDIAEIGFHAAVSVTMNFGPDGSGSYSHLVPNALKNRFRYGSSTQYLEKSSYSTTQWETILQEQIDNAYPLYYSGQGSGGGHAFVCDAYQGMNYYHFNFGWSGSGNGFYSLQDVGGFSSGQAIVRNILPGEAGYPYIADGQEILTTPSGSFTDGSGPVQDYPSGMDASWLISPQTATDSVKSISLSFVEFNTATSDVLRVYNGSSTSDPLIGEFSGDDIPENITIQNNQMLVTFTSSSTASGFKAEYKTSGPLWCGSSNVVTEPYGTFGDGSGNFHYNNLSTCVFILQVPEAVNYRLSFNNFSTEPDKDILKIYNGSNQLLATLSGNEIPGPMSIAGSMVFLTWTTNNTIKDEGWEISYEVDGVGLSENKAVDQFNAFPNPASTELTVTFSVQKEQDIELNMVSLSGNNVASQSISNFKGDFKKSIDLNGFAKGVYLLKVQSAHGVTTKKVVIR